MLLLYFLDILESSVQTLERSHYVDHAHSSRRVPRQDTLGSNGTLIIIGGSARESSLQAVSDHLPSPRHLTVATIASPSDPEYQYEICKKRMKEFPGITFSELSFENLIHDDPPYLDPETSGIFITGGHQDLLVDRLNTSRFGQELRDYHARGGTIIGTSAGASFMGDKMPLGSTQADGFGLVPHIIDQHFSQKKRKGRLYALVEQFPGRVGIGIDENTAVIYQDSHLQVMGEGQVFILKRNEEEVIEETVLTHGDTFTIDMNVSRDNGIQ